MAVGLVDPRAEAHVRHWDALYTDLNLWMPTWQDLTELILPRKSNVNLRRSPGRPQTERMLDATAPHALELLAASMQGSLTSQAIRWFYYRIRGLAYGVDPTTDAWLEEIGDGVYDELKWSNFSAEAHEFYTDLGCVGTAAMFIEKRDPKPGYPWQGVRFKTLGPGSYVIDEDEEGRVDTLYYRYYLTARQAASKFGMENLPDEIKRHLVSGTDQTRQFEFINCIYPRKDKYISGSSRTPSNLPWASLHISKDYKRIVKESGYHEFPFAVARWTKSSDEKYGRSPGYTVLADIKTLNKLVELKLRALANKVYPPLMVRDDGVLGLVKLSPGGLTHVRDMEAVQELFRGDTGGIQAGMLQEEKLQAAIRRGFFADQLQLQEGPQMTAYEVQVRYELMQRILGPTLGRLETEFLEPVTTRVYRIMERAGRFKQPPASMMDRLKEQGRGFDIEYEGPLQRAQRLGDVVTIQRCFQLVLPIVQFSPEIMDNFDLDETARAITKSTGAPSRMIRSIEAVAQIRAERSQQQQQQAQQQQLMDGAAAAGKAAPALKALVDAGQTGALPKPTPAFTPPVTGGVGA